MRGAHRGTPLQVHCPVIEDELFLLCFHARGKHLFIEPLAGAAIRPDWMSYAAKARDARIVAVLVEDLGVTVLSTEASAGIETRLSYALLAHRAALVG